MKYLIGLIVCLVAIQVNSQDDILFTKSAKIDNSIELVNDSVKVSKKVHENKVHRLLKKRISQNETNNYTLGYRVQIAQDNQRKNLVQLRHQFLETHSDDDLFVVFQSPYYKLRVGNYYGPWAIWEAKFKASELQKEYGSAFYVIDKISLDEVFEE